MVAIVYKEITTGKIAAVFNNCDTQSSYFNNPELFTKEISEEAPAIDDSFKRIPKISETLEQKIKRIIQEQKAV